MDGASRLAEVVRGGRWFLGIAEADCYGPAAPLGPHAERRIADAAAELAATLDRAEVSEGLPLLLGKRTRAIREAFAAILARFEWLPILEPDRDDWIDGRWERFDTEVVVPYLRAVRAWVEGPDPDPPAGLTFDYQEAVRRDLSAADLSAEQAAIVVPSLRMQAKGGTVFAGRWPEAGPDEYGALLKAIRAADLLCPAPHLKNRCETGDEPSPLGPPIPCKQAVEQGSPDAPAADAPPDEGEESRPDDRSKPPKEPSEAAIQCYRLMFIQEGKTQSDVARVVYGDRKKQYRVSRDLEAVKAWIKAGNILPDLDAPRPKMVAVDPSKLDYIGQRR